MKEFDAPDTVTCPSPIHKCCDICELECTCSECKQDVSFFFKSEISQIIEDEALAIDTSCPVRKGKKSPELHKLLVDYRNSLCQVTDEHGHQVALLFGVEITSCLPHSTIKTRKYNFTRCYRPGASKLRLVRPYYIIHWCVCTHTI